MQKRVLIVIMSLLTIKIYYTMIYKFKKDTFFNIGD